MAMDMAYRLRLGLRCCLGCRQPRLNQQRTLYDRNLPSHHLRFLVLRAERRRVRRRRLLVERLRKLALALVLVRNRHGHAGVADGLALRAVHLLADRERLAVRLERARVVPLLI